MKTQCSLLLSVVVFLASPIFASEESLQQAAKEMVEVANLDKMINSMYEHINSIIIQTVITRDPCLEPIKKPLGALLMRYDQKILNAATVKAEVQKIYAQEFTEAEIREIVAFQKTPTGQKALEKTPLLAARGMEIAQREMEKSRKEGVMTELETEIAKLIENMDPNQLSPECKKQFEERKAKAKAEAEAAAKKAKTESTSSLNKIESQKAEKQDQGKPSTDKAPGKP